MAVLHRRRFRRTGGGLDAVRVLRRHAVLTTSYAERARRSVLDRFRWVDGHADVWRLFADATTLAALTDWYADVARASGATVVAGIESRGFILGGAAAARAGIGFVAIRKEAGLFPGAKNVERAGADYRGLEHVLRVQTGVLAAGAGVLLVDDWAEIGSQALAARRLIERCGATWLGAALLVDQLNDQRRDELAPVQSLVRADELGPSG